MPESGDVRQARRVTASANGNAVVTFTIPADSDYQTLHVAYHADNKTHGNEPGKMGEETFGQLATDFPRAGTPDKLEATMQATAAK